jgi:hypothetical protein
MATKGVRGMIKTVPNAKPLTNEETIKALECCMGNGVASCKKCPIAESIKDDCSCCRYLAENALNLINELKIEYGKLVSILSKQAAENEEKDSKERGMMRVQLKDMPQIKIKPKIIAYVDGKEIDITKFVKEV